MPRRGRQTPALNSWPNCAQNAACDGMSDCARHAKPRRKREDEVTVARACLRRSWPGALAS
eukprot:11204536-Lingulodinium_polyedra.AAC.1